MSLITTDLFNNILLEPIRQGADELYIVSGYATATMATRHLDAARLIAGGIKVRLIVGMTPADGIEKTNHAGLIDLHRGAVGVDFKCNYVIDRPPVHAKIYSWFRAGQPFIGYVGSANYTQNAFSTSMRETLAEHDPVACFQYFDDLIGETIECTDEDAPDLIAIRESMLAGRRQEQDAIAEIESADGAAVEGAEMVELPILARNGAMPMRSGLNWGQRPEQGREPNQAYLKVPSTVYRTDFFPNIGTHFTVFTDDDKTFVCTRAQANGKGIHTPLNNSLIGEYFRYRLGLPNGSPVTLEDLQHYGRDTVTFYKIDDETYYMDFSVR